MPAFGAGTRVGVSVGAVVAVGVTRACMPGASMVTGLSSRAGVGV